MRPEYSTSYAFRLTGLLLLFIGVVIGAHLIVETWNWTVRLSLIGVWDEWEVTQTYLMMRYCILTNLALTTIGLLFLSVPSYSDELTKKHWSSLNFKKVLATMVLTGGTVYANPDSNKYCVRYYGKSTVLHQIICALARRIYNVQTEPARWITRNSYVTQIYRKGIVEDLLALSPTYNTRNRSHNNEENAFPTAAFLLDAPLDVVREAVRVGASANGGVRYTIEPLPRSDGRYHIRPQFTFGHLSPKPLLDDYRAVLERVGIHTTPVMDGRFGKGFLRSRSWDTCAAFKWIGGFIDNVKVHRGRYSRLDRNDVLQRALTFYRSEGNSFATKERALETVDEYLLGLGAFIEKPIDNSLEISTRTH